MQEPMTLTIIECCGNCQYGNVLLRNLGDNFRDNLFYPRIIPQLSPSIWGIVWMWQDFLKQQKRLKPFRFKPFLLLWIAVL